MPSSGIWRRVVAVKTDVPEERIASIIRMKRISKLGTTLAELTTETRYKEMLTRILKSASCLVHVCVTSKFFHVAYDRENCGCMTHVGFAALLPPLKLKPIPIRIYNLHGKHSQVTKRKLH
jgi:hypothetical protein